VPLRDVPTSSVQRLGANLTCSWRKVRLSRRITFGALAATFVLFWPWSCRSMNRGGDWPIQAWHMASVLKIHELHVSYRSREGVLRPALSGVSFSLEPGEILGVLGESGSGKSTLAAALVRLLPANGGITGGAIHFEGKELLQLKLEELREVRGGRIALIFQEASLALHPTMRVGEQVRQVLHAHSSNGKSALRETVSKIFSTLFAEEAERIARSYPHQLSGGQRQRVLIAQAVACGPRVIIADEPTASLDPTTQMEILGIFRTLREKLGLAMIFITHNPALLAGFADRVMVLYGGRVIELGPETTVLGSPRHPYTKALFQSIPTSLQENGKGRKAKLPVIAGDSSSAFSPTGGCSFEPRCLERMESCREREPALVKVSESHLVSCFKYEN
jgi:oligopeptide/dipeptide ABC transporter ATP-binding protein